MEPRSPALQADSLPSEPPGKLHSERGMSIGQKELSVGMGRRGCTATDMNLMEQKLTGRARWDRRKIKQVYRGNYGHIDFIYCLYPASFPKIDLKQGLLVT